MTDTTENTTDGTAGNTTGGTSRSDAATSAGDGSRAPSRRALIAGGMDEAKVLRVVGLSSAVLFDKQDPFNPINRRISIVVMNKQAEESASREGGTVEVSGVEQVRQDVIGSQAK